MVEPLFGNKLFALKFKRPGVVFWGYLFLYIHNAAFLYHCRIWDLKLDRKSAWIPKTVHLHCNSSSWKVLLFFVVLLRMSHKTSYWSDCEPLLRTLHPFHHDSRGFATHNMWRNLTLDDKKSHFLKSVLLNGNSWSSLEDFLRWVIKKKKKLNFYTDN